MDGNGRWATRRGRPRAAGHLAGALAVWRAVDAALHAGGGTLTLYAFSADNWRRPGDDGDRRPRAARRVPSAGPWALACAAALGLGIPRGTEAQRGFLLGPGAEFAGVGVSRLATGALDARLAAGGYPAFGRAAFAVSLGGYRTLPGGWTLGAEWHGVIQGRESRAGRTVGFGGGYGTLGLGYAVEVSPRARVYPRIGLGVAGLGLGIARPERALGFDEVLATPDRPSEPAGGAARETSLTHTGLAVDVGAGAELLLGSRRGRRPLVGVRLGYLAMPSRTNWRLDDRPVSGGPAATLAGPYVRVTVGTGRRR